MPTSSPPLSLVAPFMLTAPLGLVAAGLLLATAGPLTFVGINLPSTVAITHALVIGWISTTIMGATYQLVPVVVGGELWSPKTARVQYVLHVGAVAGFVWSLHQWDIAVMGFAGVTLVVSFILYVANIGTAIKRGKEWSLTRTYLAVSVTFLCVAAGLGITWVGTLQHLWFPVTLGRLSAHAHLGLLGWIGITVMGVSYQLVPMFTVVQRAKPRLGHIALAATAIALALFAYFVAFGADRPLRVALAALLAVGPLLWAADQVYLLRHRGRKKSDIQVRSTYTGIAFLAAAIVLGIGSAAGGPFTPAGEPARGLLAYAAAGIAGWAGCTLIGNSYKILPFLIWFHRYRSKIGIEPVPVAADIYSEPAANAVLFTHALAVCVVVIGALSGHLDVLRAGGGVLAVAGVAHLATLLHMFLPKQARRPIAPPRPQEVSHDPVRSR